MVELDPLGGLDGYAPGEVLGKVALVDAGLLHHLTLGDGILVQVFSHRLGNKGLVTPITKASRGKGTLRESKRRKMEGGIGTERER